MELSFPLAESSVAGVLNLTANLLGIGLIYAIDAAVRQSGSATFGCAVLAVALVVAVLLFAIITAKLRRQGEAVRLSINSSDAKPQGDGGGGSFAPLAS